MGKKHQTVGPFELRFGKNPGDPDSERGWRIYEDGDVYDDEVFDCEEDAESSAEQTWSERLQEEITENLPSDVDDLQAILKFINEQVGGEEAK